MQNFLTRILALVVGVVIGIGVVIGALTLIQDDQRTAANKQATRTNFEGRGSQDNGGIPTGNEPGGSITSVSANINELVFPEQAFDRKAAMLSWIALLSEDQILSWLEQSSDPSWNVSTEILNEFQSTLLQKLTITAPQKAVAFAWTHDEQRRDALASVVFLAWASTDLDGAITHVMQLDEQEARHFLPTILRAREDLSFDRQREIAKELGDENFAFFNHFRNLAIDGDKKPEETWYEIINIANRENAQAVAGYALSEVAVAWVEKNGLEVLDEIVSSVSHATEYDLALTQILNALSEDQPEEIFDFALSILGDRAHDILQVSRVIYNWARRDPKGVLAKAETLPASGLRRSLVWRAMWQWAADNPRQILKQINLVPGEFQTQARLNAIRSLTSSSPNEAAKFVLQEQDPDVRMTLANSLVSTWAYQDAEAAKDWVLGLPTSDPMRVALLHPLAMALVHTDPREAFKLARERPIEDNASLPYPSMGYESSIIGMLAYQDVDLAIELLPQVRDQGKAMAYSTVGNSLIRQGETRQAIDLANQLPKDEQTKYFRSVSSTWAWQDPQGLLNSLNELPSAEIRSRVALSTSMTNTTSKNYTDEEIARLEKYMTKEDREKFQRFQEIDMRNPSPEDQKLLQKLYSW